MVPKHLFAFLLLNVAPFASAQVVLNESSSLIADRPLKLQTPHVTAVEMAYGPRAEPRRQNYLGPVTDAAIRLAGLPPGGAVEVLTSSSMPAERRAELDAPVTTPCRGASASINTGTNRFTAIGADGTAVIGTAGMRHDLEPGANSASGSGPCSAWIGISVSTSSAAGMQARIYVIRTPAYELNTPVRYTYENTWPLRRYFSFRMKAEGASTCSGTSLGPNNYPVGVHERSGDLALQVRSGPAGTVCRAASPGVAVPDDLRLVSIDWDVQKSAPDGQSSRCCAGNECMERVNDPVVMAPGNLPSNSVGTYQGTAQADIARRLGVTAPTLGAGQSSLGLAHAWMACDATAFNDHGVRIVLKSAVFEGPAGLDLPK